MRPTIFAVTTPSLVETGCMTHEFMLAEGVPISELTDFASVWGLCKLRQEGERDDPWRLLRMRQRTVGGISLSWWDLYLFNRDGFQRSLGAPESTPKEEWLQQQLLDAFSCQPAVVLMPHDVFGRFKAACKAARILVRSHHHPTALSTSS